MWWRMVNLKYVMVDCNFVKGKVAEGKVYLFFLDGEFGVCDSGR